MSTEKKPQTWRIKVTPRRNTPAIKSYLGNRMTRAEFDDFRDQVEREEIEFYGTPSFRRDLVPVDENGKEIAIEALLEAGETERARLAAKVDELTAKVENFWRYLTAAATLQSLDENCSEDDRALFEDIHKRAWETVCSADVVRSEIVEQTREKIETRSTIDDSPPK